MSLAAIPPNEPQYSRKSDMQFHCATSYPSKPSGIAVALVLAAFFTPALFAGSRPASVSAAPAIRVLSGANQQTVYASPFAAPLTVWVSDAANNSLPGVRVNFTASSGIRLSADSAVTDDHGLATVTAIALAPSANTVTAAIATHPKATAIFENLLVNKATLTVVPTDHQASYGPLPSISTYAIQGFVNGDTAATANITGSPALTTTATNNSHFGNYAIKGGVGTLSSPNYTFVAGFGILAIIDGPVPDDVADRTDATQLTSSIKGNRFVVRRAIQKQFTAALTTETPLSAAQVKVADIPTPASASKNLVAITGTVSYSDRLSAPVVTTTRESQPIRPANLATIPYAAPGDPSSAARQPIRSAIQQNLAISISTPLAYASSQSTDVSPAVHGAVLPNPSGSFTNPASPSAPIRKALNSPPTQ
jgi:hypothetical protein